MPNASQSSTANSTINGAAENALRAEWGLDGAFVVGYAGNLGRAHEIETIVGAIKALHRDTATETAQLIKFLFIGGGSLREALEEEVRRCKLSNVLFRGYQPREQLAATLSAADVHLVSLNPKLEGLIVPSKIYAIAAAGRPAIFLGHPRGEIAKIIQETGIGFAVPSANVWELQERILQLVRSPELRASMGARARAVFEQRWDKDIALSTWERLLNEITNSAPELAGKEPLGEAES